MFYLHHSQVDRLWWLWQQKNSGARWDEYGGPSQNVKVHARHDENVTRLDASVEDMLSLGILAKDLRVKEVMTTQSDLLCYMYQ